MVKPICDIALGNSGRNPDPAKMLIDERHDVVQNGWMSPIWQASVQKYIDMGSDIWLHNPFGDLPERKMMFDQRLIAKEKGLEKLADIEMYGVFTDWVVAQGCMLYQYIGAPQNIPGLSEVPYKYLRDWMWEETRHLHGTNRRVIIDAAYTGREQTHSNAYADTSCELSWEYIKEFRDGARKNLRDVMIEAIPSRSDPRWLEVGIDCVALYRFIEDRCYAPWRDWQPTMHDSDFPKRVFVIFHTRDQTTAQEVRDGWTRLHTAAPHIEWHPVLLYSVIDRDPGIVEFVQYG